MRRLSALGGLGICALFLTGPAAAADDKPRVLFRFDRQVTESSGLVDLGSRVLTINDSGDDAVVYVVDPRTGETVGRTTYADEVSDVEALALGPDGDVWVGDIGDNGGSRTGVTVHRVPPPRDGDRRVTATTYDLVYRGGARDAETLLVSPEGRLIVVSKGLFGGQVWQGPEQLSDNRANVLTPVGDAGGLITDGAWFPDGRHVVLRDYDFAYIYDVTETPWRYVHRLNIPDLQQGEGIAVRGDGDLLISSEGQRQPVVVVPLPTDVADAVAPSQAAAGGDPTAGAPSGPAAGEQVPTEPGLDAFVEGRDIRVTAGVVITMILIVVLVHRFLRLPR